MRQLVVLLGGSSIARLIQTDGGQHRLSYDLAAVGEPLSVALPLQPEAHHHSRVDPFLEGLLPDNAAVREALARRFSVSPRNPFALLEHIGHDCAGAVQFAREEEAGDLLARRGALQPISDEAVGKRLVALAEDRAASWIAPAEGWSLAGAQAKIALRRVDGAWYEARGAEPTTHILKPGISGMREQALCEHLCLGAAREAGIPAARTSYERLGATEALVIERYDRQMADGGRLATRLHQEDLCQATGTYPHRKYESNGGPSALDVITLLSRWATDDGASIRRFVDALILNVLLGAPDAHAKNYSILHSGRHRVLAPLYDLASGLPYRRGGLVSSSGIGQPDDTPWRTVAMSIGGTRDLAAIGASRWERFAAEARLPGRARMDGGAVVDRMRVLAALLPDVLATVIERERRENPGLYTGKEIPSRLLDAVAVRCAEAAARP